jgi:hypothetical protein
MNARVTTLMVSFLCRMSWGVLTLTPMRLCA